MDGTSLRTNAIKGLRLQDDPVKFVEAVARAGYATDPNYAKNLAGIIRSHRLDQYDR